MNLLRCDSAISFTYYNFCLRAAKSCFCKIFEFYATHEWMQCRQKAYIFVNLFCINNKSTPEA